MTHREAIRRTLWWLRLSALAGGLALGVAVAAAAVLACVVAAKILAAPPEWAGPAAACVAAAAIAVACAVYARRRPSERTAAIALDSAFGLRERLLTALHASHGDHPFREAILAEGDRAAARVRPAGAVRWQGRRPLVFGVVALAAAGAIHLWAPEIDLLRHGAQRRADAAAIQAVAAGTKQLEQIEKRLGADATSSATAEALSRATRETAALRRLLESPEPAAPREAMARVSALADKITEEKDKTGGLTAPRLAPSPGQPPDRSTARLERALRRGDLQAAREELARLAQKARAQAADSAAQTRTADELTTLAATMAADDALGTALADAARSLNAGDAQAAASALAGAQAALDSMAAAREDIKKLDEALAALESAKSQLASAAAAQDAARGESAPGSSGGGGSPCPSCGKSNCPGGGSCSGTGSGDGSCSGTSTAQGGSQSASGASGNRGSATTGGGASDWGVGTTNLDAGAAGEVPARTQDAGTRQSERDSEWTGRFIRLYDPRYNATQQQATQASGRAPGAGPFAYSIEVPGQPGRETPSSPEARAFLDYRESQKDAISREDIPAGYKELVKGYFDSITPARP